MPEQPPLYNSGWTLSTVKAKLATGANLVDIGVDFNSETRAWLKAGVRSGRLEMVDDFGLPLKKRAYRDTEAFERALVHASAYDTVAILRVLTGDGFGYENV